MPEDDPKPVFEREKHLIKRHRVRAETADRDVVEGPHDQGCDDQFTRMFG